MQIWTKMIFNWIFSIWYMILMEKWLKSLWCHNSGKIFLMQWICEATWKWNGQCVLWSSHFGRDTMRSHSPIHAVSRRHQPVVADERSTAEQLAVVIQSNEPGPGSFFGIISSNNLWADFLSHQFFPTCYQNNGRKSSVLFWWIFSDHNNWVGCYKITSGDKQALFRIFNWKLGRKRDKIFTYVYGYIVTESVNPVNTVHCNRRTIIFQKLCT